MIVLGVIYFLIMMIGAGIIRRPPSGWKPAGWTPTVATNKMIRDRNLSRNAAVKTPQFFLLSGVLFINVTAGVGILAQASPMMQDMFHKTAVEAAAAVSLISLFNAGGRFFWGVFLRLHRPPQYLSGFLVVQIILFLSIPGLATKANGCCSSPPCS